MPEQLPTPGPASPRSLVGCPTLVPKEARRVVAPCSLAWHGKGTIGLALVYWVSAEPEH